MKISYASVPATILTASPQRFTPAAQPSRALYLALRRLARQVRARRRHLASQGCASHFDALPNPPTPPPPGPLVLLRSLCKNR